MKNLILNVTLPIVGVVLLAVFAPASLGIPAGMFASMHDLPELGYSRFSCAACGVLVFGIGEVCFHLGNRWSTPLAATLTGRLIQIVGFAIALWALLSGAFCLHHLASPGQSVSVEQMVVDLKFNQTLLTVGLCVVAFGQVVIGVGRFLGHRKPERVSIDRESKATGTGTVSILSRVFLILTLFVVLALFAFTILFELAIGGLLKQSEAIDVSQLAHNFQGMIVYPFLAYLALMFYCLVDGISFVIAKSKLSDQTAQ